jgi:hypothetical protein
LEDVQNGVKALFDGIRPGGNPIPVFIHFADLKGVKTFVVGFGVRYGTFDAKVFLQGFPKTGLAYEFAVESGESMKTCDLQFLDKLNSPRENEIWLLAHGGASDVMRYVEVIVLYSFDGYGFKELWSGSAVNPEYKFTDDGFTVTSVHKDGDTVVTGRDRVRFTSGGPVVSTQEMRQK